MTVYMNIYIYIYIHIHIYIYNVYIYIYVISVHGAQRQVMVRQNTTIESPSFRSADDLLRRRHL